MTKFNRFFITFVIAGLFAMNSPAGIADDQSYGSKTGQKAARSFANLCTAWLEIPKNMINVSNQSNVFYGIVGGMFKGLVHTAGRLGVAVADLITLPLPTQPIAHPIYIWEDFDIDTTYGDAFRYDSSQNIQPQPVATEPAPVPQAAQPAAPVPVDDSEFIKRDTNRKLDSMFQNKMTK
ncbi:MAG: exosortase system-associated protein, TIGR04073 family [Methylococcaceae bacterium]|nr:exosortase system-associated protein, TIGR04073 family [Methylococcaceae bacterium]